VSSCEVLVNVLVMEVILMAVLTREVVFVGHGVLMEILASALGILRALLQRDVVVDELLAVMIASMPFTILLLLMRLVGLFGGRQLRPTPRERLEGNPLLVEEPGCVLLSIPIGEPGLVEESGCANSSLIGLVLFSKMRRDAHASLLIAARRS
jgi:hypothetical protein